jgi:hypothetical protein
MSIKFVSILLFSSLVNAETVVDSTPRGLGFDHKGNILVFGSQVQRGSGDDKWDWLIRRAGPGISKFKTAAKFRTSSDTRIDFAVHPTSGRLYFPGARFPGSGIFSNWMIFSSDSPGASLGISDRGSKKNDAWADAVTVDPSGHIWVAGFDVKTMSWVVKEKKDRDFSWKTVMNESNKAWGWPDFIAAPTSQEIFVAGKKPPDGDRWIVRGTANGGKTWAVVDEMPLGKDFICKPHAIATSPEGNTLVGGHCFQFGNSQWILRIHRNCDPLHIWSTLTYPTKVDPSGLTMGIYAAGDGRYFVTSSSKEWELTTYLVSEKEWSLVDLYRPAGAVSSSGIDIKGTLQGAMYAIGSAYIPKTGVGRYPEIWFVRRSLDFGRTWTTADEF